MQGRNRAVRGEKLDLSTLPYGVMLKVLIASTGQGSKGVAEAAGLNGFRLSHVSKADTVRFLSAPERERLAEVLDVDAELLVA